MLGREIYRGFAALWLGSLVVIVSLCGGAAAADAKPLVVFVTGDDEYRSEITMPMIAEILERNYPVRTQVLFAKPKPQSKNNIEGLEALEHADLAVFFLRFRALPDDQLRHILNYVNSGKPIVGLRTSTHAFLYPKGHPQAALNDGFGRDVFGQKWLYHHGHSSTTEVEVEPLKNHPILRGIAPKFHAASWLYHVLPLEGDSRPLLIGNAVRSEQPKQQPEPVAWTKTHKGGRVFFTTLGHPKDFENESMRRLLVNGILWVLDQEVPRGGAKVDFVRPYVAPPTSG